MPSDPNDPPSDSPLTVALDAATAQFTRMPTSNPWDYAHAIVRALHRAGLLTREPTPPVCSLCRDLREVFVFDPVPHYRPCPRCGEVVPDVE